MKTGSFFKIKAGDYLLAILTILLFLSPALASYNSASPGLKAVITSDNSRQSFDLSQNREISVSGLNIEIRNSCLRVTHSNCLRHICEHSGVIAKPGEIIVCVPNRVIIEIQGNKNEAGYDAVAY